MAEPTAQEQQLAARDLEGEEQLRYFRGAAAQWGGGLTVEQFVCAQQRVLRSAEAEGRYRLLGRLGPDGQLRAGLKTYRMAGEIFGRPLKICGIGAVWTPTEHRRRGHAGALLRDVLAEAAALGADAALLFSDIGTAYYARFGFTPLESSECRVAAPLLPEVRGARPAAGDDAERVTRILAQNRSPRGLSLSRDGWSVRFQLRRLRELARVRDIAEPEWGLLVDGLPGGGEGAALVRYAR
jgi:hypothetical protein